MMGGALFPYFEACSHLDLHRHEMTEKQIMRCKLDINRIFERNKILFNTYPMVFNDACRIYAVYMFILKNQDQIYADSVLTDSVLKMKLLESDFGYWFAHTRGEITLLDNGKSAVIEMGGEKLYLAILEGGIFTVMPAEHLLAEHYQPTQNSNDDVRKLVIRFEGTTDISVAIAPMPDGEIPSILPENKPLAEW